MFSLIKVISFKFAKLNILNTSRNFLFILLILFGELKANLLKKKLDTKNNDVIIITDFKGDSLSNLINQLKSNSTLKPLSERIERTIKLSNQKNNQHSLTTLNYLNGLNSFIKTNDKSSKLSNKLNLFGDNSNDKNYYKPLPSFNYLNNYNQLYQRLNGYGYSQARYPQGGYFVQNNRQNQVKDFNYPSAYQVNNYDPNKYNYNNYNYNHKTISYDYKPLSYEYKPPITFDQNKYLPANYDHPTYAYSTIPPVTTVASRPQANSISDIISNQQDTDFLPDANSSFIDLNEMENSSRRKVYESHPFFRSRFRSYHRPLPPSIPFYYNANGKNFNRLKSNHHTDKQASYNQTDHITNEFINSLINKLNEKKLLNNQNSKSDKNAMNLPVNLNQLANKSLEEQDELIKNSNLLTKFEQINNKILTNLLLTTYLSNLSKNQPKINASSNRSLYLDTLEDDSQGK